MPVKINGCSIKPATNNPIEQDLIISNSKK